MELAEVSVKGTFREVPSLEINGKTIVLSGRWLKLASIFDEDWQMGKVVQAPDQLATMLKEGNGLKADIFTFTQKPTDKVLHYAYSHEWESVAAIPISSYMDWWNHLISTDVRKDIRRSAKRGVAVRVVPFTDDFVHGIMDIYDETPVRQGRSFWHYKKSFEEVKRTNSTYLERSEFVGAYLEDELVGFLKIVYVDQFARLMQIICKVSHRDRRPMNALIAKAVEQVDAKGCSLLTYGKYCYSQGPDGLTAFKQRNGFKELRVPRYYVPLTLKGELALRLHLHRGVSAMLPTLLLRTLKRVRSSLNDARTSRFDAN